MSVGNNPPTSQAPISFLYYWLVFRWTQEDEMFQKAPPHSISGLLVEGKRVELFQNNMSGHPATCETKVSNDVGRTRIHHQPLSSHLQLIWGFPTSKLFRLPMADNVIYHLI